MKLMFQAQGLAGIVLTSAENKFAVKQGCTAIAGKKCAFP
jgi:hypothetical protein